MLIVKRIKNNTLSTVHQQNINPLNSFVLDLRYLNLHQGFIFEK